MRRSINKVRRLVNKNYLDSSRGFELFIFSFSSFFLLIVSRASNSANLNILVLFSSSAIIALDGSYSNYFRSKGVIIKIEVLPLRT
jgi:hypothetical protein